MLRRLSVSCSFAALLATTACSDTELVGLHLRLQADGTGVLTTRTLVQPTEPGPAETRTQGVVWQDRATLSFSQGTFQNVKNLKFGEIYCGGDPLSSDRPGLRIFVPRGPDMAWVQALAPNAETRRKLAKVYDPTGKTAELAGTVRIELQLPANVIATGVLPTGRGIEADHERNRAWLSIPVQTALEKGDELVWEISWVTPR
jgi:hypothetical protein